MEMTISHAQDVIQNIGAPAADIYEVYEAIDRIFDMPTHNSVSKDTILKACRWLRNRCKSKEAVCPKREWISVEDRLPPFFEDVLVFLIDESGPFIGISFLFDNMGKLPYWAYFGIGGDPQYWMPLPAPPEVDE